MKVDYEYSYHVWHTHRRIDRIIQHTHQPNIKHLCSSHESESGVGWLCMSITAFSLYTEKKTHKLIDIHTRIESRDFIKRTRSKNGCFFSDGRQMRTSALLLSSTFSIAFSTFCMHISFRFSSINQFQPFRLCVHVFFLRSFHHLPLKHDNIFAINRFSHG